MEVRQLRWGQAADEPAICEADVILGADVVWGGQKKKVKKVLTAGKRAGVVMVWVS